MARDTEPFFQPTSRVLEDSPSHQRTGPDFSSAQQLSTGKLPPQDFASGSSSVQRTGPDSYAAQQPSAGKLPSQDSASGSSTVQRTGPDTTALKQKSASKLKSDHHRPKSSTRRTGPDTTVAVTHRSTGKPHTLTDQLLRISAHLSPTPLSLTDLNLLPPLAPGLPHYRKHPEGIASLV